MAIVLIFLIFSASTIGVLSWFEYGVPELLHSTYDIMDFCESFFVKCVEYSYVIKVLFIWAGVVLFTAGLAYGLYKGGLRFVRIRRAVKKLPVSGEKGSVVLISDDCGKTAFTHGLLRPRVYISTGLIRSLDRDELKVVFYHELHHKRNHDPLKFFLLMFLKDMFFYIPVVRYLAGLVRLNREHRADDSAAASPVGPLTLASALLKVARFNADMTQLPVSFLGSGYKGSVEERIRRLVEGGEKGFKFPPAKNIAASLLMTSILALTFSMPFNGRFEGFHECTQDRCVVHHDKSSQVCKMHCSVHEHKS